MDKELIEAIEAQLAETLKPSRYAHSIRVAERAAELAEKFGEDREKAYLAGILHDIGKVKDEDTLLKICDNFDIILGEKIKEDKINLHSEFGKMIAKIVYKISDEDILNSIRYHTTGRENMSRLEKIVYLADYTEYGRDFEEADEARRISDIDLDEGMLYALKNTIMYVVESGNVLHIDTVKARNFLIKEKLGGRR